MRHDESLDIFLPATVIVLRFSSTPSSGLMLSPASQVGLQLKCNHDFADCSPFVNARVSIDLICISSRHAVRKTWISFQRPVLQKLDRPAAPTA
jgi:hypothetical protein